MASTLGSGAPLGHEDRDRRPDRLAARATPWAWLPAEAATTRAPSAGRAGDVVVGAPDLERAGALAVLGLEQHGAAGQAGQGVGVLDRRGPQDPGQTGPGRLDRPRSATSSTFGVPPRMEATLVRRPCPPAAADVASTSTERPKDRTRAHVHPQSHRDRARLARRRRRGPGARPPRHRGGPGPAGQAQADLRPPPRHRRPRHHRQRRQGRAHRRQGRAARWSTATPATRAASSARPTPTCSAASPPRPCAQRSRACCRRTASAGRWSRSSRSTPGRPPPRRPAARHRSTCARRTGRAP